MAVRRVLPRQPCPAAALTFTRLNHSFIRCLAPPSFFLPRGLPPLPTGTAEPFEPDRRPGSHLSFSKAPHRKTQFSRKCANPLLQLAGLQAQPSHSHQDVGSCPRQHRRGCAHGFPSPPHPRGASSTLPAHLRQQPHRLQHLLLTLGLLLSSDSKAPVDPSHLHPPPVPLPGGRREESICIPRYPKEIRPPKARAVRSLGWEHSTLPAEPPSPRRSSVPGSPKGRQAAAEQAIPLQRGGNSLVCPQDRALDEAAVLSRR